MITYIVKRLIYSLLIIWGVVTLVFILFNLIPGDPARMVMGQRSDEASLQAVRRDLGLDRPLAYQYLKYLNDLSPLSIHNPRSSGSYIYLDRQSYNVIATLSLSPSRVVALKSPYLRRSYQSGKTVGATIRETFPNTLVLAITAMSMATLLGLGLGVVSALTKDGWVDRALIGLSAFGMSVPSFFAAILFGWVFAYLLGPYTGLNLTGNLWEVDHLGEEMRLQLGNLVLPTVTLGLRPLAVVTQLTRSTMLEVLSQDFIRTARAKGLSSARVVLVHALRNALNPVVSAVSGWFASLMAGVVFIEFIYGWKGLGYVMVNALNSYDVPLVLGCVITISIVFVAVNLIVDIIYSFLDPRVRLG